jgi:hypothetical protein
MTETNKRSRYGRSDVETLPEILKSGFRLVANCLKFGNIAIVIYVVLVLAVALSLDDPSALSTRGVVHTAIFFGVLAAVAGLLDGIRREARRQEGSELEVHAPEALGVARRVTNGEGRALVRERMNRRGDSK